MSEIEPCDPCETCGNADRSKFSLPLYSWNEYAVRCDVCGEEYG